MSQELILYHGSCQIVEHPQFGLGKPYNDYGPGFYCTESAELAKEWACGSEADGYANQYCLDMNGLTALSLSGNEMHILNWLAILVNHRTFRLASDLAVEGHAYLSAEFLPDLAPYDVIRGYRADDSYFSFATGFLSGAISLEQLSKAMRLGKLGEQVMIKSPKAFEHLRFLGYEAAPRALYYPQRAERDEQARTAFRTERSRGRAADAVYMLDLLREGWKNDDPRLRRYLCE